MPYTMERLIEVGMPIAMAALAEAANRRETITYKEIARRIEPKLRSPMALVSVGDVVGGMMYKIYDNAPKVPPLANKAPAAPSCRSCR